MESNNIGNVKVTIDANTQFTSAPIETPFSGKMSAK
jgi:hypothetical protein